MISFLHTYVLIWQLPVALFFAFLSIYPIRTAYRLLRIGDWNIIENGAVEQAFWASFWLSISAIFYIYMVVCLPIVWLVFQRKHLLSLRAWMAAWLAMCIGGLWYYIIYYLLPLWRSYSFFQ